MKFSKVLTGRSRLGAACAIGLAVWALRVALVGNMGTGIPWMDQWDCEGLNIYEPWVTGRLSWRMIFAPYLEHHIAWTHLWNLGLFEWCGQWDPMVQMVAHALISALIAGFCVWSLIAVHPGWTWRSMVLIGGLMAFGNPFGFQNILWGFQSCFALFIALSVGGCWLTAHAWQYARYGWLTLFVGLAAPLALGAGILAGPIIIALTILMMLAARKVTGRGGMMLAAGLICTMEGLWLRSNAPPVDYAYTKSLSECLRIWLIACGWPNCRTPWLAGLACLPSVLLLFQVLRKKIRPQPHELFLIGIVIWAVGCAAGGAWARGALGATPPSRYCDFLALLCWANLLAMFLVLRTWWQNGSGALRTLGVLIALAWLGSAICGGIGMTTHFITTDRPTWQESAIQQFEEANSVLFGVVASTSGWARPTEQRMAYQKVFVSQALAPFLPPEIRLPFKGITPENTLAVGQAEDNPEWRWESGSFDTRGAAMIVFVRGGADKFDMALLNQDGQTEAKFLPSGRQIGQWAEWLARPPAGRYRMHITAISASSGLAVILPRPLSAAGYWARWISAEGIRLVELAGICLAIALLVCRAKEGSAKGVLQSAEADA